MKQATLKERSLRHASDGFQRSPMNYKRPASMPPSSSGFERAVRRPSGSFPGALAAILTLSSWWTLNTDTIEIWFLLRTFQRRRLN